MELELYSVFFLLLVLNMYIYIQYSLSKVRLGLFKGSGYSTGQPFLWTLIFY